MERTMIYELLMKAEKNEIADLCAGILDLLNHRRINSENNLYKSGWNDSRASILGNHYYKLHDLGIDLFDL